MLAGDVITRLFSYASWRLTLLDSYDERIVPIFLKYATAHFAALTRLRLFSPILLPIVAPFDEGVHEMREQLREATQLLSPFLRQTRLQAASPGSPSDDSITGWLLQHVEADRIDDDEYLTKLLLAYNITFVFGTVPLGTSIVNETAFRPDFSDIIRQEADSVLGAAGWQFNKASLRQLTKLDSFCKETHRHYPTSACKCNTISHTYSSLIVDLFFFCWVLTNIAANLLKKVHKHLTLPNGTVLPKGTTFEVAIQPANLHNPKLDQPAEWIGLRYHDLREQGGFSDKLRREYEWGAATRDDMSFGYGSHVCPGKAQGCDMLKMFFVKLLKAYELKLEDGVFERYGSVEIGQYVSAPVVLICCRGSVGRLTLLMLYSRGRILRGRF